jgi:hypothetical protein
MNSISGKNNFDRRAKVIQRRILTNLNSGMSKIFIVQNCNVTFFSAKSCEEVENKIDEIDTDCGLIVLHIFSNDVRNLDHEKCVKVHDDLISKFQRFFETASQVEWTSFATNSVFSIVLFVVFRTNQYSL